MPTKHQPAGAFGGKKLTKAPDTETHPLAPNKTEAPDAEPAKLTQFSARLDPELLRQVKIAIATRGTTLQAATAEAFELWLSQKSS
ncbi:hypothetical protein [Rhodococcus marinonascens]|uniref:hypothetical protein n=1 Tax=Rhodococcus marinonascens TaxID=38311 RepID=UPI000B2ED254|nr:hypothetical protein [Rhodococcus marinonascens]